MKSPINPQGASEFARTGTKVFERRPVAAESHFLDAACRFQSTNQNKAIFRAPFHKEVQKPVHAVVQIHIRRAGRHPFHEPPR